MLADRPTEERARPAWSLTWAVPRDPGTEVPRTVHAPTPTDEPLGWPALLVADLPLDPDRRHVVPGAAAEAVVAQAAEAYGELLGRLASDGVDVLPLVPSDLPGGWVAGALRDRVLALLPGVRLLPSAAEPERLLRPADAVALTGAGVHDPALLAVLAPMVDGLVAVRPGDETALRLLQVRRTSLADVVEQWPEVGEPSAWAATYRALLPSASDPALREALAGLPVPLADGRVVRGARGLLLPSAEVGVDALAALHDHGLRAVHPDVAHDPAAADLLERLGAQTASAATVLAHPAVRSAVAWTTDDPEPDEVVDAVLALVQSAVEASPWQPGSHAFLGDLALPDDEGEPAPAGLLVRPGSPMARLLDPEAVGRLDADVADRWPAEVLQAVGVAGLPVLVRVEDADPDDLPPELDELDGAQEWADEVTGRVPGAVLDGAVLAVRDLDLVVDDGWPELLDAARRRPRPARGRGRPRHGAHARGRAPGRPVHRLVAAPAPRAGRAPRRRAGSGRPPAAAGAGVDRRPAARSRPRPRAGGLARRPRRPRVAGRPRPPGRCRRGRARPAAPGLGRAEPARRRRRARAPRRGSGRSDRTARPGGTRPSRWWWSTTRAGGSAPTSGRGWCRRPGWPPRSPTSSTSTWRPTAPTGG